MESPCDEDFSGRLLHQGKIKIIKFSSKEENCEKLFQLNNCYYLRDLNCSISWFISFSVYYSIASFLILPDC
jgi:hypothetical protein